jgi:hypothetical protein
MLSWKKTSILGIWVILLFNIFEITASAQGKPYKCEVFYLETDSDNSKTILEFSVPHNFQKSAIKTVAIPKSKLFASVNIVHNQGLKDVFQMNLVVGKKGLNLDDEDNYQANKKYFIFGTSSILPFSSFESGSLSLVLPGQKGLVLLNLECSVKETLKSE